MSPSKANNRDDHVQIESFGDSKHPTLVYVPGIHGDSTMVTGFRHAVKSQLHFVELTYPRTTTWTLHDYAKAVDESLHGIGVTRGWLLGESFGSQVVWPLVSDPGIRFQAQGVILAGGFVRHPWHSGVLLARHLCRRMTTTTLRRLVAGYVAFARWRYRTEPEILERLDEFMARRTDEDRLAAIHRLNLIADNNPEAAVRQLQIPIYSLIGVWDPIVPWPPVSRFLKREAHSFRSQKLFWLSDHNVLNMAAKPAAKQALQWIFDEAEVAVR